MLGETLLIGIMQVLSIQVYDSSVVYIELCVEHPMSRGCPAQAAVPLHTLLLHRPSSFPSGLTLTVIWDGFS